MPYIRIETAEWLSFPDGTRVLTPEAYLGWHVWHLEERRIARVWKRNDRLQARIEHGRWLVDCVSCGTGMLTHPLWQIACCGECGAVYDRILFPNEWKTIEEMLLKRPIRMNQNWFPTETLDMLIRESLAHGVV